MKYIINLPICYQNFDYFKLKSILILNGLFKDGRINDFMTFDKYGIITSLNKKNDQIEIEEFDKFTRGKINCLVYKLTKNKYNPDLYDKLIIYYNNVSRDTVWYGYIFYNSKTNESLHKYYIEYADDVLSQHIWNTFMMLHKKKIYNFYSERYNALKNKKIKDVKTIGDYNKLKLEIDKFKCSQFTNL